MMNVLRDIYVMYVCMYGILYVFVQAKRQSIIANSMKMALLSHYRAEREPIVLIGDKQHNNIYLRMANTCSCVFFSKAWNGSSRGKRKKS